ncbi:2OG-Fe(II) oxygenase [Tistrella bauzanensis]
MSIQLSAPEDYAGGDLVLEPQAVPITGPRRRGTAIAFPSYVVHEVTPVTQGQRYSLVAWIHGPGFV